MERKIHDTIAKVGYQIGTIWWPDGWEPTGPLDVPNCVLPTKTPASGPALPYSQAESMVQALNRQCIDSAETTWYVLVAAEGGPAGEASSEGGQPRVATLESRIVRPPRGTAGDCSCCPAHNLRCARGE